MSDDLGLGEFGFKRLDVANDRKHIELRVMWPRPDPELQKMFITKRFGEHEETVHDASLWAVGVLARLVAVAAPYLVAEAQLHACIPGGVSKTLDLMDKKVVRALRERRKALLVEWVQGQLSPEPSGCSAHLWTGLALDPWRYVSSCFASVIVPTDHADQWSGWLHEWLETIWDNS